MVHFNPPLKTFASVFIGHHHVAGEQLGLTGVVVLDHEALEINLERQLLHQQAIGVIEQGEIARAAFGNQDVAAKARVALGQPALGGNVANHRTAAHNFFAAKRHLRTQNQIAVKQAADADDDDAGVRKDIAQAVGAAGFGSDHGAALVHRQLGVETSLFQTRLHPRHHISPAGTKLGAVGKRSKRLLAQMLFESAHLRNHLGRVAQHAQTGGGDKKREDQHEPPGVVDRVK